MDAFVDCLDSLLSELQYGDRTLRDYLKSRYCNEGLRFFTNTLPLIEEALLVSLETGYFNRDALTSFRFKGKLLHHFYGWLCLIYNTDGSLIRPVDEVAFYGLCQLSGYWKKLCLLYPDNVVNDSINEFVTHDNSLKEVFTDYTSIEHFAFRRKLRSICTDTFRQYHKTVDEMLKSFPPRFGPGTYAGKPSHVHDQYDKAVATTVSKLFYDHIHTPFEGLKGFFFKDLRPPFFKNRFKKCADTSDYSELLLVPKTAKGPRTIVREPLFRLAVQMSFFDSVSSYLEKTSRGRIQFTSQSQNNELARKASVTGSYATLDLSKASDSVSYRVVKDLLGHLPCIGTLLTKFRTSTCRLPDGRLHRLHKLAGMGSGLTFPILALLCHHSICAGVSLKYSNYDINYIKSQVYVYGDDIIIPVDWVPVAVKSLGILGFKVNTKKSFSGTAHGSIFRESCGGNYLNGEDVTVKRLRLSQLSETREHFLKNNFLKGSYPSGTSKKDIIDFFPVVYQIDKHCRELINDGFVKTANIYYDLIETYLKSNRSVVHYFNVLKDGLPRVWESFPGLGRYSKFYSPTTDKSGKYEVLVSLGVKSVSLKGSIPEVLNYGRALRKGASEELTVHQKCTILSSFDTVQEHFHKEVLTIDEPLNEAPSIRELRPYVLRQSSIMSL